MKSYLIRLIVACWFVGMVAFFITEIPVRGEGGYSVYLPVTVQRPPVVAEPPLSDYQMITTSFQPTPYSVVSVRADGSAAQVLAQGDLTHWQPVWSPDNRTVAFLRAVPFAERRYDVMLMNMDGSNPRVVVTIDEDYYGLRGVLTWSTDNRYLLINQYDAGTDHRSLLAVDIDTDTVITVLESREAWKVSPTGTSIAFARYREGVGTELWVAPFPTGSPQRVSASLDFLDTTFEWAPNGDTLLFMERDETLVQKVVAVSPQGTNRRVLAEGGYAFEAWLYGGKTVLLSQVFPGTNLYTVPAEGGTLTPLTNELYQALVIGVSPQDDTIFYYAESDGILYLQRPDGAPRRAVPLPNCILGNGCFTASVTWAYDGSGLVFINRQEDPIEPSYATYTAYYVDLTEATLSSRKIENFSQSEAFAAFLPRSSTWLSTTSNAINLHTSEVVYFPRSLDIAPHNWKYLP